VGVGVLLLLFSLPGAIMAQAPVIGGYLQLDRRLELGGDSVRIADFYNRFRPEISSRLDPRLYVFASLDLRFYDFTTAGSTVDLEDVGRNFPTELTVWEAYANLSGVLVDGLDVTIGKQRIQWGTADELNPTDQLNAYDFSDLTNFTARVPSWAARLEYYVADLRLEAVWLPTFHPPILPRGGSQLFLLSRPLAAPQGATVRLDSDYLVFPSRSLGNGSFAAKLAGYAAGFDYSLSYFDGFDGLPIPRRVELAPAVPPTPQPGTLAGKVWLTFPRVRTVGADFATERGGVGLWGEGALVYPKEVPLVTVVYTGPDSVVERGVALEDSPFLKSALGLDYMFPGGWYANIQWAHGLFFERGAGELHDYFVGRLEKKFSRDQLKLAIGGALEIGRWSDLSGNYGWGAFPELTYAPLDNLEMVVGTFLVDGRGESLFGAWDDTDQAYLRLKVSF
jgi:hypothetical protein